MVSNFQAEDLRIISNHENQAYSQQIKNKRCICQSGFQRICKVENPGSTSQEGTLLTDMEHHSSSPTDCTETSHPTELLKTQLLRRNFSALYLSVTFSSMTTVLYIALLLSGFYLHRASVFCHPVLMNHHKDCHQALLQSQREMVISSVSECLPKALICPLLFTYL